MCKIHERPVLGVCLRGKCMIKRRLVCFKCACTDHKHGTDIVPIQEIIDYEETRKNYSLLSKITIMAIFTIGQKVIANPAQFKLGTIRGDDRSSSF